MVTAKLSKHPVFGKYRRQYLHRVTGYSEGLLCRVATNKVPPSRAFRERVSHRLHEPEAELFRPEIQKQPLGMWLDEKCRDGQLSLRQAAAKTGLSHATIKAVKSGERPSAETLRKLAHGVGGGGGASERSTREDRLLLLAGYRTGRPEDEEPSDALTQLMDKVRWFSERQLKMMVRLAEFFTEAKGNNPPGGYR